MFSLMWNLDLKNKDMEVIREIYRKRKRKRGRQKRNK